jgi:hypothetical protein
MVARRSRRALRHLKAFFDFSETAFPSLAAFMCSGSSLQLSVHPTGCHTANLRHKSVGLEVRIRRWTQQFCLSRWQVVVQEQN